VAEIHAREGHTPPSSGCPTTDGHGAKLKKRDSAWGQTDTSPTVKTRYYRMKNSNVLYIKYQYFLVNEDVLPIPMEYMRAPSFLTQLRKIPLVIVGFSTYTSNKNIRPCLVCFIDLGLTFMQADFGH
jgi:hypothetical protein